MTEMKKHIYDESNGLWYELIGDYYIPVLTLSPRTTPIVSRGGYRDYLKEYRPLCYNDLILSGQLWTYLVVLNEQAQNRLEVIIDQMKASEGVTEELKAADQMAWVGAMNSIRNRAEEIILRETKSPQEGCGMKLLEEFWYGNIEPTGTTLLLRSTKNCKS